MSILAENIDKIHTTSMGAERIKRNLGLDCNPVEWCKAAISCPEAVAERKGKNWYVRAKGAVITVNAYSFTIITAHRE